MHVLEKPPQYPTVRCFQMRLSVNKVSYSSTHLGKRSVKSQIKSSKEPSRFAFIFSTSFSLCQREGLYCGMLSGKSRYTHQDDNKLHAYAHQKLLHNNPINLHVHESNIKIQSSRQYLEHARLTTTNDLKSRDFIKHDSNILRTNGCVQCLIIFQSPTHNHVHYTSSKHNLRLSI